MKSSETSLKIVSLEKERLELTRELINARASEKALYIVEQVNDRGDCALIKRGCEHTAKFTKKKEVEKFLERARIDRRDVYYIIEDSIEMKEIIALITEYPQRMDVPKAKMNDPFWLKNNLHKDNSNHRNYHQVMVLIEAILKRNRNN